MSSSVGLVAGAGTGTGSGVLLSFLIGELLLCTRTLRVSCCLGLRGGCGFVSTVSFVCLGLDELRLTTSLFSTPEATCTSVMKCESKEGRSLDSQTAEAVLFDAVNTKNSFSNDEEPGGEDENARDPNPSNPEEEGRLHSNEDVSIKDATTSNDASCDSSFTKKAACEEAGEGEDAEEELKGADADLKEPLLSKDGVWLAMAMDGKHASCTGRP